MLRQSKNQTRPIMYKHLLVAGILLLGSLSSLAGEERNILQKAFENVDIAPTLVVDQSWVPYPVYSDRAGWESLLDEFIPSIIKMGDENLGYQWLEITDDDYDGDDDIADELEYDFSKISKIISCLGLCIAI